VPIEERPMDVWIASFIKNVYNPTQWVWQKEKKAHETTRGPIAAPTTTKQTVTTRQSLLTQAVNTLSIFFASVIPAGKPKSVVPKPTAISAPPTTLPSGTILSIHHTENLFGWLKSVFSSKPRPASPSLSPGFSFSDALFARPVPTKKPQTPAPPPPPTPPQPVAAPSQAPTHGRVVELQGQLSEALSQREKLEKELIAMRQQMERQSKTTTPMPTRQAGVTSSFPNAPIASVRVIAPGSETKAGLPKLTTFPNVVTGIVKDNYGNLLAGMLITVRDKDDVPLRALKTNKLGQFAASTPLPNNTYIVEIEDPKGGFTFDKAQISLNGTVAPPIEVTAKSQKQVERDKLAREIFGSQPI